MKILRMDTALTLILLMGAAGIFVQCGSKKVSPVAPAELDKQLRILSSSGGTRTIIGLIRDVKTGLDITGATVTVIDTAGGGAVPIASGTTDASGKFQIPGVPVATYLVNVSKSGYIDATITAFVEFYYWSVNLKTTFLLPVSAQTVIGPAGGLIQDGDDEGDTLSVAIPAGALNADVNITLTHLQGMELPSVPPEGHLSFAAVNLGPSSMVFQSPATLTVPLPRPMTPGVQMPLYSLNSMASFYWRDSGIKAVVDPSGITASASITQAGLYSVMPAVRVNEIKVDSLLEQIKVLPSASGFFTVTYKNQYQNVAPEYVDFPDGASEISHWTLRYMFEQYHGVPFTRPETETVFYEAPTGFYPFQLIQIRVIQGEMILPDPAVTVPFNLYIKRPAVRFVPHDQGCGF